MKRIPKIRDGRRLLYYLGSPITTKNPCCMIQRLHNNENALAFLLLNRYGVYCPMVHWHAVCREFVVPSEWSFWSRPSYHMLDRCDGLLVLTLPHWEESNGLRHEIARAKRQHKPIYFMCQTDYDVEIGTWSFSHQPQ